jgi:general nucleoside transport system permease protein
MTENTFLNNILKKAKGAIPILLALLGGFVIGGIFIAVTGDDPFLAYGALLKGAVGDKYNLASTLGRSAPIIGCGIAAALAFKAGLFNIGGEGQMVLGGLAATVIVLFLPPGIPTLILAVLVGTLAGGFWGVLSAWFETQFRVPILISSLLMNYIAIGFVSYMVSFPLIELGGASNQTPMFPEASRFGRIIPTTNVHYGIILIAVVVIIAGIVLYKTVGGYEIRMFGANPEFAVSGGVKPVRLALITMLASGMVAGLVGANQVLGVHYRFIDGALTLPGYAWTGIMAAILSNNNPIGVVLAGLFFSALQTGAAGMERATDVPIQLSDVIQAIMIVLIAVRGVLSLRTRVKSHD